MNEALYKSLTEGFSNLTTMQERQLHPILVELEIRKKPVLLLLNAIKSDGNPYRTKRRKALPIAHPEGSGSKGKVSNSKFEDYDVRLHIIRSWGSADAFSEAVTPKEFRLFLKEVLGCAAAVLNDVEAAALMGAEQADFAVAGGQSTAANGVLHTFKGFGYSADVNLVAPATRHAVFVKNDVDALIDSVIQRGGVDKSKLLQIMSTQAVTRLTNLLGGSNETFRYGVMTEGTVPVVRGGGIHLQFYRQVPLLESDDVRPIKASPTLTLADGGTTGSLVTAGTYRYKIAAVTHLGEQLQSAEATRTLGAGQNIMNLSWTAFKFDNSEAPYTDARHYRIYRTANGGAADSEELIGTIPALTWDTDGTPNGAVATFVDNGATGVQTPSDRLTGGAFPEEELMGTATGAKDEIFMLINRDPDNGCILPMAGNPNDDSIDPSRLMTFKMLAPVRDAMDFLVRSFSGLGVLRPQVAAIMRNVRADS